MANHLEENKITVSLHETVFDRSGPERSSSSTVEAVKLAEEVANVHHSPRTASMFRLYCCLILAYLCGCLNGHDGSLMGGLNAMTTYQRFFHMSVTIYWS